MRFRVVGRFGDRSRRVGLSREVIVFFFRVERRSGGSGCREVGNGFLEGVLFFIVFRKIVRYFIFACV